jgi:addiction module RelB/DinJ family antitoxin
MEKTATLNLRVNPEDKKSAEIVLSKLGVPMATAVDMFLKQIALTGSIPFAIALPKAPDSINMDLMSISQIREKLEEGLSDVEAGRMRQARDVFEQFRKERSHDAI